MGATTARACTSRMWSRRELCHGCPPRRWDSRSAPRLSRPRWPADLRARLRRAAGAARLTPTPHRRARMDLGLRGKAALVTGSSRGIGRGIALELAREGCRVALCARGKDALDAAAAEVRALGVETVAVAADVTTADGVREAVEAALTAFGAVDVLVNNVGGSTGSSFLETSEEDWQRAIDLNLMPAVRASRLVVPVDAGPGPRRDRQHRVDLRPGVGRQLRAAPDLHRGQGGGDRHVEGPRDGARASRHPRERGRAGLDHLPGRRLGAADPRGSRRDRRGSSRPTCRSGASAGPRRWGASWPFSPRTRPAWSSAPA